MRAHCHLNMFFLCPLGTHTQPSDSFDVLHVLARPSVPCHFHLDLEIRAFNLNVLFFELNRAKQRSEKNDEPKRQSNEEKDMTFCALLSSHLLEDISSKERHATKICSSRLGFP